MARKLGLGEAGEIITTPQRKDGNGRWKRSPDNRSAERWRARVYFCSHDGIRRSVDGFGRRQIDAITACNHNLAERLQSTDGSIAPSTLLVDAGRHWLAQMARPGSGKGTRTHYDYSRSFNRIIDVEGSSLRGLTLAQANDPQRLRGFLQRAADNNGSGSAQTAKSVLAGIIGYAVQNGVLPTNAVRQVGVVKSLTTRKDERDRQRAMTRNERDHSISYAYERAADDDLNPRSKRKRETTADLVAFLAGTGVRIDEARSLLWNDLDLDRSAVRIRGTKTERSDRNLSLPTWLRAKLVQRIERLRLEAGYEVHADEYVFAAPGSIIDNTHKWDASNSSSAVRAILDGADLPWAIPHTFRRTVATLLHQAGIPISRIADQLGHADPGMTARVYLGRDFEGEKSDLAAVL